LTPSNSPCRGRIPTHLPYLASVVDSLPLKGKGWGRGLREEFSLFSTS